MRETTTAQDWHVFEQHHIVWALCSRKCFRCIHLFQPQIFYGIFDAGLLVHEGKYGTVGKAEVDVIGFVGLYILPMLLLDLIWRTEYIFFLPWGRRVSMIVVSYFVSLPWAFAFQLIDIIIDNCDACSLSSLYVSVLYVVQVHTVYCCSEMLMEF